MPTHATARKKRTTKSAAARPKSPAGRAISDSSVERATGHPTDHWFRVLDAFARRQGGHVHKAAAEHLHESHGVPEWWCQMVTVLYERERGHRAVHETARGYSASVSRTINVPISTLFSAWQGRGRSRWLPDEFTVRKATKDRSLRITWGDSTNVEVMFYAKGDQKAQVTVQHDKLRNAAAVSRVKKEWAARLDSLRTLLEE